jgi:hypothetical protein
MSISTITIPLPDTVLRRAQQAANVLHRSLEEVLAATLDAGLPNVSDAPDLLQAELAAMTWLSDAELWSIAQSTMTVGQQTQLRRLSERQGQQPLSPSDAERLDSLRHEFGRITLCKAHALALLSLRGGRPLLASDR